MYLITKLYKDGILQLHQEFSYKTPQELKEFKEFLEREQIKSAVLALNTNN